MSILERFGQSIVPEQENRARHLLKTGAVSFSLINSTSAKARCSVPNGFHTARLDWSGPTFEWSCTCDNNASPCAHVIAAAFAASTSGHLSASRPVQRETRPRNRSFTPKWLSSTGELRGLEGDDRRPPVRHEPSAPGWKKVIEKIKRVETPPGESALGNADWPADRQILYIIDIPACHESRTLVVRLACRDRRSTGEWSKPKTRGITFPPIDALTDADDQQILALLASADGFYAEYDPRYEVPGRLQRLVIQLMARTDRGFVRDEAEDDLRPLRWDEGEPWQFLLQARREESTQQFLFSGSLRRGEQRVPVNRPLLTLAGGVVFFADSAAALDDAGAARWIPILRQQPVIRVPFAQADELLNELLSLPRIPHLDLPEELHLQTINTTPQPQFRILAPRADSLQPDRLWAQLSFNYDGAIIRASHPQQVVFQKDRRRLVMRDPKAENLAIDLLRELGARYSASTTEEDDAEVHFHQKGMPRLVRDLVRNGWHVEAHGRVYRTAGQTRLQVASGIDWFELRGDVDFAGHTASLPALLAAIKRGENMVQLDDGTVGMIPEEWMKRFGLIASLGDQEDEFIKFSSAQVGLLDALLAAQEDVSCDETFERAREALRHFDGIQPIDPPASFIGTLRPYQRDGLGWFGFLERFGFGGCLADDMGLGKTVQVLALLEARRSHRSPSLVVVPKSLVFNWHAEAIRFTPQLRILDHTGIDRIRGTEHLSDYDVIITTYGTLRRDVEFLKDVTFDYVVLDEAQAIKNPNSESAKALRLIKGSHRLTLSGTPVQNHLGDLWSLFDFLNPGMLGSASLFNGGSTSLRNPEVETRQLLARALRPFILRRTKEQVAADLPPRIEQTFYCELDEQQRKLYDELRLYYRQNLLEQIDRVGLGKSKMLVLEALLRLRQAALHPGLIDKDRMAESSAKLDLLLPQLDEVIDEGHKALVFSQFTSMLAIVRDRLDQQKIPYEYLDGQTRDREARVKHFQSDETCKLFLISLKAGGLGLNLTAADYVFLLDPWWNPAIEQQAIDRTHRIGQTRQVYACRLIAKDTVEEKVLALQEQKRDLADAIITADNSLIRTLGREDLELLLS